MAASESKPPNALLELFLVFARIGVSSFGGGMSGWIMREVVWQRNWMSEEEFLTGMAMSQALPGVNVVNLPLWIGYKRAGLAGALVSAAGVIVPPLGVVLLIMAAWQQIEHSPHAVLALRGAAAAAMGMSLSTGLRAAWPHRKIATAALLLAVTFIAVGLLRLPLLAVVGVLAPMSCWVVWRQERVR